MTQSFNNVTRSDNIDTGLLDLLARDLTALTAMSGDSDPENPPQDAVYDNRTAGVLKLNGNVLIDYKNGFMNSTALSNALQPLNSILTSISEATLNVPCIVTTAGGVIQVNNYGTSAANNTAIAGVGTLAKRSNVGTNQVEGGSITQEKLETPLSTTPVFKCGDILYSARSGNRTGFLLLGAGRTLGGATSSATYRSNDYYLLYNKLWSEPNAVIRNSSGTVVSKGNTSSADFSSNNSVDLPAFGMGGGQGGQFEVFYNSPGIYTYVVPSGVTKIEVDCVGAAGGAAQSYYGSTFTPVSASKGGRVQCTLSVNPNQFIYLYVGGQGESGDFSSGSGSYWTLEGGFNGGGTGSVAQDWLGATCAAGGGASDLRIGGTALTNRVVVAGGGGGSFGGVSIGYSGGDGGGLIGGDGKPQLSSPYHEAKGGTQSSGGTGSYSDSGTPINGTLGKGGGCPSGGTGVGGGGGGYYGGGAGGSYFGSSAGGSSYTDPDLCDNVTHTQGYSGATGDGYISIKALAIPANAYIKY